jgi:hypothetical protein
VGSTVDPSPANQPTPGSPAALAAADTTKILNEGNAALKAKDYEKAVDAALAAQQQKILTQQQSEALRNQMVQLQQDLVNAIAAGDAKAKAASQRLRQAASGSQ